MALIVEDISVKGLSVLQVDRIHVLKAMAVYESSLLHGFLKSAPIELRMEAWQAYQGHRAILVAIDAEIVCRLEAQFADLFN